MHNMWEVAQFNSILHNLGTCSNFITLFQLIEEINGRCIRPTQEELENFGTPDFTIYNAGQFPCNRYTHYMTSSTSIDLNLKRREMVILGTQYAGEMKKGLFTVMHYLMPKRGILSLHSGCNMGKEGDVTLFFGLSGRQILIFSYQIHQSRSHFNISTNFSTFCIMVPNCNRDWKDHSFYRSPKGTDRRRWALLEQPYQYCTAHAFIFIYF